MYSLNLEMNDKYLYVVTALKNVNPNDASLCLQEALASWLQLDYDWEKHSKSSWQKIAEAVMHFNMDLFKNIAKKHSMKNVCIFSLNIVL